jgi:hypothetical protein
MIHSSIENFQPELQPNSEQKADEMHVSPSYCQCNVSSVQPIRFINMKGKVLPLYTIFQGRHKLQNIL